MWAGAVRCGRGSSGLRPPSEPIRSTTASSRPDDAGPGGSLRGAPGLVAVFRHLSSDGAVGSGEGTHADVEPRAAVVGVGAGAAVLDVGSVAAAQDVVATAAVDDVIAAETVGLSRATAGSGPARAAGAVGAGTAHDGDPGQLGDPGGRGEHELATSVARDRGPAGHDVAAGLGGDPAMPSPEAVPHSVCACAGVAISRGPARHAIAIAAVKASIRSEMRRSRPEVMCP